MKKTLAAVTALSMLSFSTIAGAATKGTILPSESVTFQKNGQIIAKYTDQAPIDDSALITCQGACSVKLPTMSLNVSGDTTFALRDNEGIMNVYVKEGLATFTIKNITQQVSFYTPDGRYVKSEGFIAPTSTESNVKGYINVTAEQAEIGIQEGGMILATADGIQTVDAEYAYKIDLNELPATGVGAGGGLLGGIGPVGLAAGAVGVAGVAGAVAASGNNDKAEEKVRQQGSLN